MSAGTLSRAALETIRQSGLTRGQYVNGVGRSEDGRWHGDRCGCLDDCCIGYHHDETDECGCLPVWIEQLLDERDVESGAKVMIEHDCARGTHTIRHTVALAVVRRVRLGCGCTRVEALRCRGGGLLVTFEQVCPVVHE